MQNTRVRKLFSTILGVGAMAGSLVLSSCEDEFTEQDAIKAQQESLAALESQEDSLNRIGARINYTVTVAAAGQGSTTNGRTAAVDSLGGATVTLVQGGTTYTETANEGGVATFAGLLRGEVAVTVKVKDHTMVTYTTVLGSDDVQENNVSTLIPVFPMTLEAGATKVSGKAWAELDATNDTPEFAEGAVVRAKINLETALSSYRTYGYGGIETATYEGFVQEVTVDENGDYSLIMPNGNGSSGNGFAPTVEFIPFIAKQKYMAIEDGKLVEMEKDVFFGSGSSSEGDHLADVPGVYLEIEAPDADSKAEGFEAKAELVKQALAYGNFTIAKGGSGYAANDVFELSADGDNVATITVLSVDTDGAITDYTYASNGAEFAEKPSITAKTVSGTGAEFTIDFTSEYQVVVTNPGSGYWTNPTLSMVYIDEDGDQQAAAFSGLNVTDGRVGEKDDVIEFRVKNNSGNATGSFKTTFNATSVPTIVVDNPVAKPAMVDPRLIQVNDDGHITSVSNNSFSRVAVTSPQSSAQFVGGAGYMSAPKVTFTSVNGGAGAEGIAIIENGSVVRIEITKQGAGYQMANDTDHETAVSNTPAIKAGTANVGYNRNYGSGVVQ